MTQLMDRLAAVGEQTAPDVSDATVQTVVRRAHAGLTRRRQKIGAASLAVLAVVGVGTAGASGALSQGRSPTTQSATAAALTLVAYDGPQPNGFHLDVIPQGYRVERSTAAYVQLAPDKSSSPSHDIFVSLLPTKSSLANAQGFPRHLITLSRHPGPSQPVTVNGQPGTYSELLGYFVTLSQNSPDVTLDPEESVSWTEGSHHLFVSCDDALLTKSQLLQLADGVRTVGDPHHL